MVMDFRPLQYRYTWPSSVTAPSNLISSSAAQLPKVFHEVLKLVIPLGKVMLFSAAWRQMASLPISVRESGSWMSVTVLFT